MALIAITGEISLIRLSGSSPHRKSTRFIPGICLFDYHLLVDLLSFDVLGVVGVEGFDRVLNLFIVLILVGSLNCFYGEVTFFDCLHIFNLGLLLDF